MRWQGENRREVNPSRGGNQGYSQGDSWPSVSQFLLLIWLSSSYIPDSLSFAGTDFSPRHHIYSFFFSNTSSTSLFFNFTYLLIFGFIL